MGRRRGVAVLAAVLALVSLAGCGNETKDKASGSSTTTASQVDDRADELHGTITVSAAASLTESFTAAAKRFEQEHPDTHVKLNFGSSGTLSQQILDGAPTDVLASADTANMAKLTAVHATSGAPVAFARNELAIVTKPGNPHAIKGLADLPAAGVIALCATTAPCGVFAGQALAKAAVNLPEDHITRGQDVKATLAAVSQGDASAGIVYTTDARSAGSTVSTVAIPDAQNVIATYPIAVTRSSGNAAVAKAFVEFIRSAPAQAILKERGFLPPS